jgi:hypothetical protein
MLRMIMCQLKALRRGKTIAMKGNNKLDYYPNIIWKRLL